MTAAESALDAFTAPIGGGLTPADAGVLDIARAGALDRKLRDLDTARRRAWLEIRNVGVR